MTTEHGWFTVAYSYATFIECECGFRPSSQEDMDAHIPPTQDRGERTMSTHTKVNEEVYSEYDCTLKDCSHDECPTERVDICEECTREAWEEHEGGAVTWIECLEVRAAFQEGENR